MRIATQLVVLALLQTTAAVFGGEPPESGCCVGDACYTLTQDHCAAEGAQLHSGSSCDQVQCGGDPEAACCIEFECLMLGEMRCLAQGGHWNGGMQCEDVVCKESPAYGACCFEVSSGMSCVEIHEIQCHIEGGDWQGPHTVCVDAACSAGGGNGACCINGGCLMLKLDECDSVHGQWSAGHCDAMECAPWCEGDIDGDGVVGVSDILILLANWGPCV
jgi:hypothetical protein